LGHFLEQRSVKPKTHPPRKENAAVGRKSTLGSHLEDVS
jgi:hypothetical protein